jgi:hypothetical protein
MISDNQYQYIVLKEILFLREVHPFAIGKAVERWHRACEVRPEHLDTSVFLN